MLHPVEEFQLAPGETLAIHTQDHVLYVQRQPQQWLLCQSKLASPHCSLQTELRIERNVSVPHDAENAQRWLNGEEESTLRIVPCMADKSLVVKPESALVIPAGRKPTLYLSLPIMYQLFIGQNKKPFHEFFIESMPLTWFGSNTRRGELCYQSKSPVALSLEQLPQAPHRVQMEMRIHNRDSENLNVEKINLPALYLPIYRVDNNVFWTSQLTITNEKLTDELSLHYGKGVPGRHQKQELVSQPRLRSEARTFMRALEAIIG